MAKGRRRRFLEEQLVLFHASQGVEGACEEGVGGIREPVGGSWEVYETLGFLAKKKKMSSVGKVVLALLLSARRHFSIILSL